MKYNGVTNCVLLFTKTKQNKKTHTKHFTFFTATRLIETVHRSEHQNIKFTNK